MVDEKYNVDPVAEKKEEAWTENIDEKIDTTIRALNAIKGEVKDYKKQNPPKAAAGKGVPTIEEKIDTTEKNVNALLKAWRKVRVAINPNATDTINEEEIKENMKNKLDTAIDTMTKIKEALDEK